MLREIRGFVVLSLFALWGAGCPADRQEEVADMAMCAVDLYAHPVCGVDGKTYGNPEVATVCAKVAIAYDGPCHD